MQRENVNCNDFSYFTVLLHVFQLALLRIFTGVYSVQSAHSGRNIHCTHLIPPFSYYGIILQSPHKGESQVQFQNFRKNLKVFNRHR